MYYEKGFILFILFSFFFSFFWWWYISPPTCKPSRLLRTISELYSSQKHRVLKGTLWRKSSSEYLFWDIHSVRKRTSSPVFQKNWIWPERVYRTTHRCPYGRKLGRGDLCDLPSGASRINKSLTSLSRL